MNKLLSYYQKELSFLKRGEFSRKFPKIARRLGYHHGLSQDPHIERLTESFAFLSSKIHQRLDEDLPEVMEALLQNLAPQFLYKYPSSCIISIEPSHNASGMTGICNVPSGTPVFLETNSGPFVILKRCILLLLFQQLLMKQGSIMTNNLHCGR